MLLLLELFHRLGLSNFGIWGMQDGKVFACGPPPDSVVDNERFIEDCAGLTLDIYVSLAIPVPVTYIFEVMFFVFAKTNVVWPATKGLQFELTVI